MADRIPVAYIRRSSADDDNPGDISREAQEAAVRELAHRDGHNGNLRVFVDWDRSADEAKEHKRTAFLDVLREIEAGHVSEVYAYALDRLYRSMRTFVRLTDAAKAHNVRIVTLREGVLGGDGSPMAQAFAQITAVFSELELNTAKARSRSAMAARRDRGDRFGHAPYGFRHVRDGGRIVRVPDPDRPLDPVIAAYRDAGSVLGACRLLEARGVTPPAGGARWGTSTLTRILDENAPDLLPRRTVVGRRTPASAALAQLLRCPFCGRMLTPNTARAQYYCANGPRDRATHPRYVVAERDVLPFLQAEADRLDIPGTQAALDGVEAQRDAIDARLARAHELYIGGDIDRDRYAAEKAKADRDAADLDARASVVDLPPSVDWTWHPARLNAVLRALWREVRLDDQLRPVEAEWLVPEWRA